MKKIHWFTDTSILKDLERGDSFEIRDKEVVKQVYRVLKLQKGEHIILKNVSFGYECEIISVSHEIINVLILNIKESTIKKRISLMFCIPKKDKFELLIEKCTEIGVTDFYPIISDRTIKMNINEERSIKIIKEASEQAQRIDTPVLHKTQSLQHALEELKPIVFDVDGENMSEISKDKNISILIGPEGGFSEKELQLFKEKGLQIYKLGDTVLKTETAAILACGLISISH